MALSISYPIELPKSDSARIVGSIREALAFTSLVHDRDDYVPYVCTCNAFRLNVINHSPQISDGQNFFRVPVNYALHDFMRPHYLFSRSQRNLRSSVQLERSSTASRNVGISKKNA